MIDLALDVHVEADEFTLDVTDRAQVEVLGLYGPSGAGKTTLLETIAGLKRPSRGQIAVGDVILFSSSRGVDLPPRERRVGYVPQEALLFPHLNVRRNVLFGANNTKRAAADHEAELRTVAAMLEIEPLLDRRVQGLSGGERQRVALARALMTSPTLLLLDEPLAGVDRARRERILPYLLRIRRELHVPLVYVTHDVSELMQIADRVLSIEGGRLIKVGTPQEVLA
jgi:molybdate transport system ATP-binding protein